MITLSSCADHLGRPMASFYERIDASLEQASVALIVIQLRLGSVRLASGLRAAFSWLLLKLHGAIHKSAVLLNPIQDSLDLHPVVPLRDGGELGTAIVSGSTRDASLAVPVRGVWTQPAPWTAQNAAHQALQNRRRFAQRPQRFIDCSSQDKTTKNTFQPQAHSPTDSAEEATR